MVTRVTTQMQHLMIVPARESLMLIARLITHDPTFRVLGRKYTAAGLLEMHVKSLVFGPSRFYPTIHHYLKQWLDDDEVNDIGDQIHDSILMDCRPILRMDEGDRVIEVVVQESGDVHAVVEQTDKLTTLARIHAEALGVDSTALLDLMRTR